MLLPYICTFCPAVCQFFLALCRPCEMDDVINFAFLRSKSMCKADTQVFAKYNSCFPWFAVLRWMSAHTVVVRKLVKTLPI